MIHYRDGEYHSGPVPMDIEGEAFRYGYGFFETILWNGSVACRLDRHLERAHASLDAFGLARKTLDYHAVVPEVARRNGLEGVTGRINIHFPVQGNMAVPVVSAAPYSPPPQGRKLSLGVSPRPHHSWLAEHKSTNYLYYHLEHKRALQAGRDGMVVLDPHGFVLETATAALLFLGGEGFVSPEAPGEGAGRPGILKSIALDAAREALDITLRPVHVDEIAGFRHAWALNSLMGIVPVERIGGVGIPVDSDVCPSICCRIFSA